MNDNRDGIDVEQENNIPAHFGPRLWKKKSGIWGNLQSSYREMMPLKLFFIIVISVFSFGGILSLIFSPAPAVVDENSPDDTVVDTTKTRAPELSNVPPGYAKVGVLFEFNMIILDVDTPLEDISVELMESPDWLSLDGNSLMGVPEAPSTPQKVVVQISDGENVVEEEFYVVAVEDDVELHNAE